MSFKKFVKSIGNFVKKIGKGIKKVVKKVGKFVGKILKPFQKLGWVGQIALMFLLPYAGQWIWKGLLKMAPGVLAAAPVAGTAAVTGTAAATAATAATATSVGITAGTKFGLAGLEALGTAMTSSSANIFQKIIGRTVQAIHAGGTAFQTITGAIGTGIDKTVEWGQNLFGSDTGLITKDLGAEISAEIATSQIAPLPSTVSTVSRVGTTPLVLPEEMVAAAVTPDFMVTGIKPVPLKLPLTAPDPSFGSKVAAGVSSGVIQGVTEGIKTATTNYLAGDEHGGSSYTQIIEPISQTSYTKYNEVDLLAQNRGQYYGGTAHQANMNEMWDDPYWKILQGFGAPSTNQPAGMLS